MFKIKNSEVIALFDTKSTNSGLQKLMNHGNLDWDKAYELSLLVPELEKQVKIIDENRSRISSKVFPAWKDWKQDEKDLKDPVKLNEFYAEYGKILEKEVEVAWDKIVLSREKDKDWKSELNKLNLTAVDLIKIKSLVDIK